MTQYGVCVSPLSESIRLEREDNAAISPFRNTQITCAFPNTIIISVNLDDLRGLGVVAILKLYESP